MIDSSAQRPSAAFKDRRAGLVVFGVAEILIGSLALLMVPLLFFSLAMAPQPASGLDSHSIGLTAGFNVLVGVSLIWLGIGSILCRRWARTVLLIVSWSWLLTGILTMAYVAMTAAVLFQTAGPSASLALTVTEIFLAVFFVILPGVLVFFYRSPHVKATCEARDPRIRWTDVCPSTVLANSLWLGVGALYILATPLMSPSFVPVFGYLVYGRPAALILFGYAALWFYVAWGTYKLRIRAWWVAFVVSAVSGLSTVITFGNADLSDAYRQMGYPEAQVAQARSLGFLAGKGMAWWIALFFLLFLGYLLWIKKYFRAPDPGAGDEQS